MTRSLERAWWVLAAILGVAFFLLAGYYGWASLAIWSVLVLPLALRKRLGAEASGRAWPAPGLLVAWISALVLNLATGLAPILLPSEANFASIAFAAFSWIGAVLSLGVVVLVTYESLALPTGAA